jgi:hypothetical protein
MKSAQLFHSSLVAILALAASGATAQEVFFDNFDSYTTNSTIAGQGGWEIWCTGGTDALVTDLQAHSEPNSLMVTPTSDVVQRFNETSGKFVFSFQVYVPSLATGGSGSINLMNTYCEGPNGDEFQWSVSTTFNPDTNLVTAISGDTVPLIEDAWVEYRAEFDLDADTLAEFYNGEQFVFDRPWSTNFGTGKTEFLAADFYSDLLTQIFFDDVKLEQVSDECYADCTGDGALDLFDFLCFQNDFVAEGDYSDCEDNDAHDLFDFLCYQNAFVAGC